MELVLGIEISLKKRCSHFYSAARIVIVFRKMEEENPSLLSVAKSLSQRESKASIRDDDRTKMGDDRSALAIGSGIVGMNF